MTPPIDYTALDVARRWWRIVGRLLAMTLLLLPLVLLTRPGGIWGLPPTDFGGRATLHTLTTNGAVLIGCLAMSTAVIAWLMTASP